MKSPAEHSVCPTCGAEFNANPNGKTLEENNAYFGLKAHIEEKHKNSMFECPRQAESGRGGSKEAIWDDRQTCSWCGSIHPDQVFSAIEAGYEFEPTDKDYKVYIVLPNPEAGKIVQTGSSCGPTVNPRTGEWNVENPTEEEIKTGRFDRQIMGEASPTVRAKFYFQHFTCEERKRFVELINQKKIKIGFPGHFYRLPFFVSRAGK